MPKNERSATLKAAQRGERHSFQISSEMRTRQVRIIMITGDYVKTAEAIAPSTALGAANDVAARRGFAYSSSCQRLTAHSSDGGGPNHPACTSV